MPTRVYKVAAELGTDSKTLIALGRKLGLAATSHLSSVTEDEAQVLKTALAEKAVADGKTVVAEKAVAPEKTVLGEPRGKVTRFDKRSGKGEVAVPSRGKTKELPFDLRFTRLDDTRYVPIRKGDSVRVKLSEDERVESIRSERS